MSIREEERGLASAVLGRKIVLTASATEMSDFYNNPFIAFVGGFGKGPIPLSYVRKTLYPHRPKRADGQASYVPYGLRKVESILLEGGFSPDDIAVAYPEDLDLFIGPDTKVVGISSMDPTGMGYVSKTYSSIVGGGEPMNGIEFKKLVTHPAIKKFKPKIIVGGYGSWQLERQHVSKSYGVDCVLMGGRPTPIVELFKKAINNEPIPRIAKADESLDNWNYNEEMPLTKNVAIHGAVEISKGCGRNCQFCTPTMQHKIDVPLEKIIAGRRHRRQRARAHPDFSSADFRLGAIPCTWASRRGMGLMASFGAGSLVLLAYLCSCRSVVTVTFRGATLRWTSLPTSSRSGYRDHDMVITNLSVVVLTGIAGQLGRETAIGYALGARLEYILIPLAFGFGTSVVAMVGTNWGADNSGATRRRCEADQSVRVRGPWNGLVEGSVVVQRTVISQSPGASGRARSLPHTPGGWSPRRCSSGTTRSTKSLKAPGK